MSESKTAIVVGVGPGLGWALARRFANGGRNVIAAARSKDKLDALVAGSNVTAFACDATDPEAVTRLFDEAEKAAPIDVAVFNAGSFGMKSILEIDPRDFESVWRVNCHAGFLVGQAAAKRMLPRAKGTILFTGATASLRGGAHFAAFASAKFGLRAIAQSMARELGPRGIHVAHVIVDGIIDGPRSKGMLAGKGPDAGLAPDAIAETYAHLVEQPRSSWSFEVDVRPFAEKF